MSILPGAGNRCCCLTVYFTAGDQLSAVLIARPTKGADLDKHWKYIAPYADKNRPHFIRFMKNIAIIQHALRGTLELETHQVAT